ncbi:flagellar basal body-associated FliL family protein [Capillibacterium thermochitinicola]|uniref:Flagellar protein FliL n=1 Tax=Capillibacterium thermochitinicola TaxID=2699427 RepID=A0A8J6I275_9FIRM|nr:flagellar basal body-associated FliL family protein [Capillibacterium thermochitinicola]MBA2134051.1 flagellar basal body-associated FliL family protein [Capillibacterium thermochitinicola]
MSDKNGKANQIIITITVCLLIFFAAVFSATMFFIYKIMPAKERYTKVTAGTEVKYLMPLGDEVLVNLADPLKQKYLRLNFTLVLDSERTQQEIEKRKAQVRDLVISICRGKTSEELREKEGNSKLRTEIITAINNILPEGKVLDIFFTDFIVT